MTGSDMKLKAANLWEKTSAAGNRYFVGRLGGVKIVIFENRDRQGENDPTHILFFADGEKRGESADRSPGGRPSDAGADDGGGTRRQHSRNAYAHRRDLRTPSTASAPDVGPELNDEIPF